MIKQAIIPLAGLGTRLLPLTSVFAKELLPINGKPGIEYILEECVDAGIKEVIFIISKKNIKFGVSFFFKFIHKLSTTFFFFFFFFQQKKFFFFFFFNQKNFFFLSFLFFVS